MKKIQTLKQLDEIHPAEIRVLKEKAIQEFLDKNKISLNEINTTYHVFQFEGNDFWHDNEEEALKVFDDFSRTLEGKETQIVLNIVRNNSHETSDDEEVPLIHFERTQEDKDIIQRVKNMVQSYHDTENYVVRLYDENYNEIHSFYVFNRTEKEVEKEVTQDVISACDYSITKVKMHEWLKDCYKISESHAYELVDLIINS